MVTNRLHYSNHSFSSGVGVDTFIFVDPEIRPGINEGHLLWNFGVGAEVQLQNNWSLVAKTGITSSLIISRRVMLDGLDGLYYSVGIKYSFLDKGLERAKGTLSHRFAKSELMVSPMGRSDVGNTAHLTYSYGINESFRFNAGLSFLYNHGGDMPDNKQYVFRKRFQPKGMQHMGVHAGIEYNLPIKSNDFSLFLFDDITYFNTNLRSFRFAPTDHYSVVYGMVFKAYLKENLNYKNLNTFENKIGLGINSPLTPNLQFVGKVGIGINFVSHLPQEYFTEKIHTESSFMFSVGLRYKFLM